MTSREHSADDIEDLARRAADGDRPALQQLLIESTPLIRAKAKRVLPNPLDAEEATQDALLLVWQRIDTFQGRSKYTTWLYRVTSNACIDRYRKLKRRRSVLEDPPAAAAAPGSSPSVVAGARIDLLDAAEGMDARLIETVVMRDLLELDYAEIASLSGVPEGTARSRVSDGRAELRRRLADRVHRRGEAS